ncbi:MAG: zinc ribbon domain-containing protein [Candidatus Bathyarchaeia archaeon]
MVDKKTSVEKMFVWKVRFTSALIGLTLVFLAGNYLMGVGRILADVVGAVMVIGMLGFFAGMVAMHEQVAKSILSGASVGFLAGFFESSMLFYVLEIEVVWIGYTWLESVVIDMTTLAVGGMMGSLTATLIGKYAVAQNKKHLEVAGLYEEGLSVDQLAERIERGWKNPEYHIQQIKKQIKQHDEEKKRYGYCRTCQIAKLEEARHREIEVFQCPECGFKNPLYAENFCIKCGAELDKD